MFGLKIKKEFILDILSGKKKYFAKLVNTNIRGRIALVDLNNVLYGYAVLKNVHRIKYEEYINFLICESFSKYDALKHLENIDKEKEKYAYAYDLEEVEKLIVPKAINIINERDNWIEFNDEYSNIKYYQQSLFEME